MEQYEVDWKDYYEILRVSPDARPEAISATYKLLVDLYHDLLSRTPEASKYSQRIAEAEEAYRVLSDPARRRVYDSVFEAKDASSETKVREQTKDEIAKLMTLVTPDTSKRKGSKTWGIPGWPKVTRRAVLIPVISLLSILIGGTCFAFTQPQHVLAAPFKSAVIAMTEASAAAVSLIEEVRGVVALYERNIVSATVQSMRVTEGLKVVPAVTVPTNDMARFPSPDHSLYPDYLDKRFSQFRYTVDSEGMVRVDKSTATTDAFLERIKQTLSQLEEEE